MRCSATTFGLCVAFCCVGAQCRSTSPSTTIRQGSNPSADRPIEPKETTDPIHPSEPDSVPADTARSNVLDLETLTTVEATIGKAQPARAIGTFDKSRNRLAFQLRNVSAFSIDMASIPVDWTRPVVLSLDNVPVELRRRDTQRLHFTRTPQGAWLIVEPPKNP